MLFGINSGKLHTARRVQLVIWLQILQEWIGIAGITIYGPVIFTIAGISAENRLWVSGLNDITYMVSTQSRSTSYTKLTLHSLQRSFVFSHWTASAAAGHCTGEQSHKASAASLPVAWLLPRRATPRMPLVMVVEPHSLSSFIPPSLVLRGSRELSLALHRLSLYSHAVRIFHAFDSLFISSLTITEYCTNWHTNIVVQCSLAIPSRDLPLADKSSRQCLGRGRLVDWKRVVCKYSLLPTSVRPRRRLPG